MPPDAVAKCIDGLEQAVIQTERAPALGDVELTVTPPTGPVDADTIDRYRQLDVARLVMLPRARNVDGIIQLVTGMADAHLG